MDSAVALIAAAHVGEKVGAIAAALLAAAALLSAGRPTLARLRALAIIGALALTPILLLSDIWGSPQLRPLRHHPALGLAAAAIGIVAIALLAALCVRRPRVLPVLAVGALPFRVPISSGGSTSNLLVPLYVIVAAGALAYVVELLRVREGAEDVDGESTATTGELTGEPAIGWLEVSLMGLVVLYAVQATYSGDFSKALDGLVFFYVPFTLLLVLLRRLEWDRRLLRRCFGVIVLLALAFVAVGFLEYARHKLLLNPKVISSNMLESYFRVNSLFFDPNIYGRFLALVMLATCAAMLSASRRREVAAAALVLLLLWGGLMTSISQSSIAALLLGLAVIAALRWSVRRTLAACGALALAGGVFLLVAGHTIRFDLGSAKAADKSTSGRYTLVKDGLRLFGDKPWTGYGPGAFALEFRRHQHGSTETAASASHTIPITVAAEQGVFGLLLYLALLGFCFARLFGGVARGPPARVAVAAAFAALVLHTMLYADFLEDPVTWALLAVGTALAAAPGRWSTT
ncbi:MAG: O-antigen ligase family protein [Solirubrobacteraceae bacterium]